MVNAMDKKEQKSGIKLSRKIPDMGSLDEFFDTQSSFFRMPQFRWGTPDKLPRADFADEGNIIRIKVDLLGISKDKIKVHGTRSSISVRSDAKMGEERSGRYYYRERSSSGYYRSFSLPSEIDGRSAKAKLSDGTLEITVRKTG